MKKSLLTACCLLTASACMAQYASQSFFPVKKTDRTLYFMTNAEGEYLPILWGLDTAWPDEANMRRGVRFIGAENIGVARVSFQPWDFMLSSSILTPRLEKNLDERLRLVSYIGGPDKVKIVLNNDAPGDVYDRSYAHPSTNPDALTAYCNLIYGTTVACQEKGWEVITASPLNEPDYEWNEQGSMDDFLAIARKLKTEYPQYMDGTIRISGGNTLNCDCALPWYEYLYDYIDEGNTHQLAGDFNHYADFFARVREDGKYATADELHNVMEAMVGVEYGMQTGIWWGTAELARGEFCRASFGRRLAYVENRPAWTSAAVYRAPSGKIQAFLGSSERQALPCTYRLVSQDRDVFFNGQGPQREFLVKMPGGYGYQNGQTSAECVIDITWGEDVSPVINGNYLIMNKYSHKVMSIDGEAVNLSQVKQHSPSQGSENLWEVVPVPTTIGGDFSYHSIKLAKNLNMKFDVINWSLEDDANIILYDGGMGGNEQWFLRYAGDGYFRIFSRHSGLCLQLAEESDGEGINIVQKAEADTPMQLWRFVPAGVECETEAPAAPTALTAISQSASVKLQWTPSVSADAASYTILRAEAGSNEYNTIARGITGDCFYDNTAVAGCEYEYKVKCLDLAGNSSDCTEPVGAKAESNYDLIQRLLFDGNFADEMPNHFDAMAAEGAVPTFSDAHTEGAKAVQITSARFLQVPYQVSNYDELTVSAWVFRQGAGREHCIFDFGCAPEQGFSLLAEPTGALKFMMRNDGNIDSAEGGAVPTNTWVHVAVTITKDRAALFVDGQLVGETAALCATPATVDAATNYIGRSQDASITFDGLVEDFRVYNYAFADASMPQLMDRDITGIDSVRSEAELLATEYYTVSGMKVDAPEAGLYIVRRTFSDGSVTVTKQILN